MIKNITLIAVIIALTTICNTQNTIQAQRRLGPYTTFEQMIYQKKQKQILSYLSDDLAMGRGMGTTGNYIISRFLEFKFNQYGVLPFNGNSYLQRFEVDSVSRGQNIVGIVHSQIQSDEYIIISAHYDHLGTINGAIYNGADDNASGVTALLNLAEIFGSMKKAKMGPHKNIIFVALDGKEESMAGSKHFIKELKIPKDKIVCNINIDQIGSIIEPIHEGIKEYVIILGENTLKPKDRGKIAICNTFYKLNLDIDYTFYGSKNFTTLYYKFSDQLIFNQAGIPALLFTSGFHKHTYKITDDESIIDYPILKKRTMLIFYLIMML